jgi:TatD DNase family protein
MGLQKRRLPRKSGQNCASMATMAKPDFPLFDTHVHLDMLPAGFDLAEEVALAQGRGIRRFLIPGVSPEGWPHLVAVASQVTGALTAPGLHPMAAHLWGERTAEDLTGLLAAENAVAVGEIGLDGQLDFPPPAVQEKAFRGQLRLARESGLPVVLHCRRATGRLLEILREEGAGKRGGIWHGFSGSRETAEAAIELGFALSFGGPLTWPGARRSPEVLKMLPAEWIVIESDAPDLPPHPHRGEPNRPAYLALVAERIAALRGWSPEETAHITTANACRVLGLS